jgi:Flp pilus assembly protein TadD
MRRCLLLGLALVAVAVLVYRPSLSGPFVYDDRLFLVENTRLQSGEPRAVLSSGFQETRPLTLLAYALCFSVGGKSPLGFRWLALGLHVLTAFLVFLITRRLVRDLSLEPSSRVPAAALVPEAAALLFVVHPVASESVAYVSALAGPLSTALGLSSILLFLRAEGSAPGSARRLGIAGSTLGLLLAVLAKEAGAVVPLLTLVYLATTRRGLSKVGKPALRWLAVQQSAALALLGVLFLLARYPHARTFGLDLMPWPTHLLGLPLALARAIGLSVWPFGQSFDHGFPTIGSPLDPRFLLALLLLGLLATLAWRLRRTAPILGFGLLWFLVAVSPTNNPILQFRDFLAERHLYLALVGVAILLAVAAGSLGQWLAARSRAAGQLVPALALVLACLGGGWLAHARARLLGDPVELWRATAASAPEKLRPQLNLGLALLEAGRDREGLAALTRAERLAPRDPDLQFNLGVFRERQGELERALVHFRAAAAVRPAPRLLTAWARAANRVGAHRLGAGDPAGARAAFEEAIRARPSLPAAHYNLAVVLSRLGDRQAAIRALERVLRIAPHHAKARGLLARLR